MNDNATLLAGSGLAFVISSLVLAVLLRSGLAFRLAVDLPNQRSLHVRPTPRVGGIGVLAGILAALLGILEGRFLLAGMLVCLAAISFADDRKDLPAAARLACHLAVACAWLIFGTDAAFDWTALLLVAGIGWFINLYNFMDGVDGLAGGMAAIGFAICALAAWQAGNPMLAGVAAATSAASAGFLLFNFPPARIFLGDVGSVPLGFLAAAVGIEGWELGCWPLWFVPAVFSPFVVDATATLLKRMIAGERFWRAHRDHYYQRMVRMGWNHRRLASVEYALMALAGFSALAALRSPAAIQAAMLLVWVLLYPALMATIDRRWRRFQAQGSA